MQLNPSEISELIKSRIQGLEASADVQRDRDLRDRQHA